MACGEGSGGGRDGSAASKRRARARRRPRLRRPPAVRLAGLVVRGPTCSCLPTLCVPRPNLGAPQGAGVVRRVGCLSPRLQLHARAVLGPTVPSCARPMARLRIVPCSPRPLERRLAAPSYPVHLPARLGCVARRRSLPPPALRGGGVSIQGCRRAAPLIDARPPLAGVVAAGGAPRHDGSGAAAPTARGVDILLPRHRDGACGGGGGCAARRGGASRGGYHPEAGRADGAGVAALGGSGSHGGAGPSRGGAARPREGRAQRGTLATPHPPPRAQPTARRASCTLRTPQRTAAWLQRVGGAGAGARVGPRDRREPPCHPAARGVGRVARVRRAVASLRRARRRDRG